MSYKTPTPDRLTAIRWNVQLGIVITADASRFLLAEVDRQAAEIAELHEILDRKERQRIADGHAA